MKTPLRTFLLGLGLLTILNPHLSKTFAQGTAFTYQGVLNEAGAPASGIYDLRFAIYDAVTNGSAVGGGRTNAATSTTNGLFAVALDFGAVFDGSARWLEIGVRPNGSAADFNTLSPRQPLTSTPYAIRAANFSGTVAASQLTGTISSNNIGAGSITATMLAAGAVGSNQLATGAVTASKIGGVLFASQIPNLDASIITSGLFATNRIPNLDASKIVSGTLGDARLSANVALLNGTNVFTGTNRFAGVTLATNANNQFTGRFTGNGGGLTNLNSANLTGTISSNNIAAGSITTVMLATGAVRSNQLAAGAVTTGALADGAVTAAKVAMVSNWFALTITNPTPAYDDRFGISLAAVGTDRVLVGASGDDTSASNAGAAYLYRTDGTLLTIFTNPAPAAGGGFGYAVAAVGTDRVLIGAPDGAPYNDTGASGVGAAYLFSANGALLTTFANPTPAKSNLFGSTVAAIGIDRVLIAAPSDFWGASNASAAYLFSTNGALLTAFTNPAPTAGDHFGVSIAAVGTNRVLIGADFADTWAGDSGTAYLFSTNGVLLMTFTNPTPADSDWFGCSVAAVGSDRVLIGASGDSTFTGAAYLFSTNGALLTTFVIPTPDLLELFGGYVAAMGNDRVLIGAPGDNAGGLDTGAAYLFRTNGALLASFINPTPADDDRFGASLAAVGSDRVLIGAYYDDTDAGEVGSAYLYSLDTYTPGLVADGVNARSITTASLEDGAVTLAKLDPTIGVWTRAGDNVFRLSGKVGIGTSSITSNRLQVLGMVGATAFNTMSDRAAKRDFTAVDAQAVLARVAALPITQWRFKELPGALHLGPMAQDFRAAFGLGLDDKSIATVDADGVALAAIQGLNQKLTAKEAELAAQREQIGSLQERLKSLEQLVSKLAETK